MLYLESLNQAIRGYGRSIMSLGNPLLNLHPTRHHQPVQSAAPNSTSPSPSKPEETPTEVTDLHTAIKLLANATKTDHSHREWARRAIAKYIDMDLSEDFTDDHLHIAKESIAEWIKAMQHLLRSSHGTTEERQLRQQSGVKLLEILMEKVSPDQIKEGLLKFEKLDWQAIQTHCQVMSMEDRLSQLFGLAVELRQWSSAKGLMELLKGELVIPPDQQANIALRLTQDRQDELLIRLHQMNNIPDAVLVNLLDNPVARVSISPALRQYIEQLSYADRIEDTKREALNTLDISENLEERITNICNLLGQVWVSGKELDQAILGFIQPYLMRLHAVSNTFDPRNPLLRPVHTALQRMEEPLLETHTSDGRLRFYHHVFDQKGFFDYKRLEGLPSLTAQIFMLKAMVRAYRQVGKEDTELQTKFMQAIKEQLRMVNHRCAMIAGQALMPSSKADLEPAISKFAEQQIDRLMQTLQPGQEITIVVDNTGFLRKASYSNPHSTYLRISRTQDPVHPFRLSFFNAGYGAQKQRGKAQSIEKMATAEHLKSMLTEYTKYGLDELRTDDEFFQHFNQTLATLPDPPSPKIESRKTQAVGNCTVYNRDFSLMATFGTDFRRYQELMQRYASTKVSRLPRHERTEAAKTASLNYGNIPSISYERAKTKNPLEGLDQFYRQLITNTAQIKRNFQHFSEQVAKRELQREIEQPGHLRTHLFERAEYAEFLMLSTSKAKEVQVADALKELFPDDLIDQYTAAITKKSAHTDFNAIFRLKERPYAAAILFQNSDLLRGIFVRERPGTEE